MENGYIVAAPLTAKAQMRTRPIRSLRFAWMSLLKDTGTARPHHQVLLDGNTLTPPTQQTLVSKDRHFSSGSFLHCYITAPSSRSGMCDNSYFSEILPVQHKHLCWGC